MFSQRQRLCRQIRKSWATHKQFIDVCAQFRQLVNNRGYDDLAVICNVLQFVSIFQHDFSVTLYEFLTAKNDWQTRFQARVAALLIVEFAEDIGHLIGRELRPEIQAFITNENHDELRLVCRSLSKLRDKHDLQLRGLRNIAIGHRDLDAALQIDAISKIDSQRFVNLFHEIMVWNHSLLQYLAGLLIKTTMRVEILNIEVARFRAELNDFILQLKSVTIKQQPLSAKLLENLKTLQRLLVDKNGHSSIDAARNVRSKEEVTRRLRSAVRKCIADIEVHNSRPLSQ